MSARVEGKATQNIHAWRRRLLIGVAALAVVIVLVAWQLPGIVASIASGRIIATLSDPQTTVTLDKLKLRWSGKQEIEGLHIRRNDGSLDADLDISITAGLLGLARGNLNFGESTLSGNVQLAASPFPSSSTSGKGARSSSPGSGGSLPTWPAGFQTNFKVQGLNLRYTTGTDKFEAGDLVGHITVDGTPHVEISLHGKTSADGKVGSVTVDGTVDHFVRSDSVLDPQGAVFKLQVETRFLPTAIIDALASMDGLLVKSIGTAPDVDIVVNGTWPESLESKILVRGGLTNGELTASMRAGRLEVQVAPGALVTVDPALLARLGIDAATTGVRLVEPAVIQVTQATIATDVDQTTFKPAIAGASTDLKMRVGQVVVETSAGGAEGEAGRYRIDAAEIGIAGADIARSVSITAHAQVGRIDDPTGSPFDVQASIDHAFDSTGLFAPDKVVMRGNVKGAKIPTDLLDSLAQLDGWLVDCAGSMIDQVNLEAQPSSSGGGGMQFSVSAKSSLIDAQGRGSWVDGIVTLEGPGSATVNWNPGAGVNSRVMELLGPDSPVVSIGSLGRVDVSVSRLRYPVGRAAGSGAIEFDANVTATGSAMDLEVASADGAGSRVGFNGQVRRFTADLATRDLDKRVEAAWSAQAEATTSSKSNDETVPSQVTVTGTTSVENPMDAAQRKVAFHVDPFAVPTRLIMAVAGSQANVVGELLGSDPEVGLDGSMSASARSLDATVRGSRSDLLVKVNGDRAQTSYSVSGRQRLTPRAVELMASAKDGSAASFAILRDVMVDLSAQTSQAVGQGDLGATRFEASFDGADLAAIAEGGAGPRIESVTLKGHWPQGLNGSGTIEAAGMIKTDTGQAGALNAKLTSSGGTAIENWNGHVDLTGLNVAEVERIAGQSPGSLGQWLGSKGSITVDSKPAPSGAVLDQVTIGGTFDRARFSLPLKVSDERVELRSKGTLHVKADGALLTRSLNNSERPENTKQNVWRIPTDPEIDATVSRLVIPFANEGETGINRSGIECEADLSVSPWSLIGDDEQIEVGQATGRIDGQNLGDGLTVALSTTASSSRAATKGSVDLDAVYGIGAVSGEAQVISLDANLAQFPVSIVDVLGSMNGQLTAALGPTMNGKVHASDADLPGGGIEAHLTTDNGKLDWTGGVLREGVLHVVKDRPLTSSLNVTDAMSQTVLVNVNPLLYDVRKKSGPITLDIHTLDLPLTGDLSKANADFTLDLGLVQVPTAGIVGELLGTFKPKTIQKDEPSDVDRVESRIPPINGKIRAGSLSYDKFVMQSSGFEVTTTGSINLVKREVDLIAAVPLIGWKSVFADLTKIAPGFLTDVPLNVPFYLVVRGPIDKPTIKPDPQGAQRVAKDFFKDVGRNLLDPLFNNILNPEQKKNEEQKQDK